MKLLDFYADWCGPCKRVAPVLDEISAETGIPMEKVNIDTDRRVANEYRIMSVPTIVVLDDDGLEIRRVTGAKPKKDMLEALEL